MTKNINFSEFYSSFISFINLMSLLNDMPLIPFMSATLLELLIQSNYHLLGKGTPHQNQQLLMMKIRQSEHLRKFWIYNIQNQAAAFSTRFAELITTLILSDIMQTVMSFRTHWKLYKNITCDILTN